MVDLIVDVVLELPGSERNVWHGNKFVPCPRIVFKFDRDNDRRVYRFNIRLVRRKGDQEMIVAE